MKKFFALTLACIPVLFYAQQAAKPAVPAQPKLVVGIVVDQMRYDFIYRYWSKYGSDGFKRLVNEGYFCRNTNYNYVPTFTGPGHTAIYTGSTPAANGIIANDWYDRELRKDVYCSLDETVSGVGSTEPEGRRSPVRMLSTSITDQLRLSNNMQSKVVGIALKDRGAILPAGHTGMAYWFEGRTGNWITSTYYTKELPQWTKDFNAKQVAKTYLAQDWNTLLPIDQYKESLPDDNPYEGKFKGEEKPVFPHKLPQLAEANGQLGLVRATPFGNSFTVDFAVAAVKGENLGKGSATDFLAVSFSSTDYVGHMYGPQSIEQEDTYLRLDKDIAGFLKFLDTWVGKNNVLVFLTADHGAAEVPSYLKDIKIPSGYFKEKPVIDSLKKTMSKKYGDTLVLGYMNDQVFLDRKTIAQKNLDKAAVENFVADFFLGFKGVSDVITSSAMRNTQFTDGPRRLVQNGYHAQRSGDVCIILNPSWFEDIGRKTGTTHGAGWSYDTHVPLIWYGWKVQKGSSDAPVNITDIAPSIAMFLNIQFPNGCSGKPISGIVK
ncbi:MAG: type I phosphodiesterase/nucleotide pyrophosphatase [Bacteroidetes bacterium]|nr:MAG: type I phosphodiesterase/nucleotide pyrophosphatase [Bacteroidota bacterium]